MKARIEAIAYFLPDSVLTAETLGAEFPDWPAEKVRAKTGIGTRHISAAGECASDLAVAAAQNLFAENGSRADQIDFILLCTQSPDYVLPATACLLQDRLGIPTHAGALDFNLGCSGYPYGLGLAQGLIETGQARCVLLLTADTYTKYLRPEDKGTRTIFGDGAAATLISAVPSAGAPTRSLYRYGTDGRGAPNLSVSGGASRNPSAATRCLEMNGPEIFSFTMKMVPECVAQALATAGKHVDEIDLFVFHQANAFILENLRRKLDIAADKMFLWLDKCGNTVSSSIPIALKEAEQQGVLREGAQIMLVGFGVGYSWGVTLLRWPYLGYDDGPL